MKKYFKKGQVSGSVTTIIALVIGVGVAVLVLIFIGVLGGQTYELIEPDIQSIGNNLLVNEALSLHNVTAQRFAHGFLQSGTLSIWNSSEVINLDNFTIDYGAGTILLDSNAANIYLNGSSVFANYTWGGADIRGNIQRSITSGFSALETTGDFTPIIVLAIVIFVILGLVLGFTGIGRNSGGGSVL